MDFEIDGAFSLAQQQTTIGFHEQAKNAVCTKFTKADAGVKNWGTLEDNPLGQAIKPLMLVEVPATTTVEAVKAQPALAGKKLLFSGVVYASNAEVTVAGFR